MRYEMLGDDGQGYQLWEAKGGNLGRVQYDPDSREFLSADGNCDGWDPEGRGYVPMTAAQLAGLRIAFLRRQVAADIGSIRTPKKAAASRENGKKGGRPRIKPA